MNAIAKLSAIFLAAAVCMALPAQAQTTTSTNTPTAPRTRNPRYQGYIASIDTTNMIVTLKATARRPEVKVKVTSATKIKKRNETTKENEPAEFSAAAVGMYVSGSAKKEEDGTLMATTMNIAPKAPTRRAKAAPAAPPPTTGQQ